MRDYGKVSPQFWIGKTGRQLRGETEAQLVALYLMTSPHATMIGVFHCPIEYIAHETGLPIEGASKGLRRLIEADFCTYDHESEMVWVHEMAKFQVAESLKRDDKRCIGIARDVDGIAEARIRTAFRAKYAKAFWLPPEPEADKPLASPLQAPPKPGAGAGAGEESLSGGPDDVPGARPDPKPSKLVDPDSPAGLLGYLNQKTGRAYRVVDANVKLVAARLKSASPDEVRAVIDDRCAAWGRDERMAEYLRPATLFGAQKFEQYLGALNSSAHSPAGPDSWRADPRFADVVQ